MIAAGLAVAGSALWLTLVHETQSGTEELRHVLRLVFASAMGATLLRGISAIRRRARRRTRPHPGTTTIHGAPAGAPT
ncbi:hypothetical protein JOD57_004323 [Geodermatophilus bullaregiensis]|uniref:hypothetical protein n=1 Tax=Geodermatophilus bullaregiensis TaxID=1564160 RepID=UPI00195A0F11|nr:hypothetical protein [Geodermatophilus bullaregiensis]MBM7808486.1 hypothetical protein [Geodermatophilus bullaregiensis]